MKKKITTKNKYFKWNYPIILLILMLLPSMIVLMQISTKQNLIINDKPVIKPDIISSTLNPDDFLYYKDLTIDQSKVVGTHSNFPMLLKLYDSDLDDYAQSNGYDIVFSSLTPYQWLEHEIESYTQHYNSTHAELIAWIQIPTISNSAPTVIRMYFGYQTTLGSEQDPHALWNSYRGVWHLSESPTGTILDSSPNVYHGTSHSTMTSDPVDGQINKALLFDGSNDYLDFGDVTLGANAITVSFWMNADQRKTMTCIDKFVYDAGLFEPAGWTVRLQSDGDIEFDVGNDGWIGGIGTITASGAYSAQTWVYVTCTYDGSTARIFINGAQDASGSFFGLGNIDNNNVKLQFGEPDVVPYGNRFDGVLDEVHISNFVRSSNWIATEYSNQIDPNNFYSIGALQSTDVNGPDITILNPTWGEFKEDPFSITATIIDPEGFNPGDGDVVATVKYGSIPQFNLKLNRIGTTNDWTAEWFNVSLPDYPLGDYNIDITAKDTSLNRNEQTVTNLKITLVDNTAPTVIIDPLIPTGPYGEYQAYKEVEIKATITDTKSTVMEARVMVNATESFYIKMSFDGQKWTCNWDNLTKYANGDYTLRIWAIDGNGNVNQGKFITLNIDNSPLTPGGGDGGNFIIFIAIAAVIGSVGIVGSYGMIRIKKNRNKIPDLNDKIVKLQAGIKDTKSSLKNAKSSFNELIPPPRDRTLDKKISKKLDKKKNDYIQIPKLNKTENTSKILAQHEILKKELQEKTPNEKLDLLKKIVDDVDKSY